MSTGWENSWYLENKRTPRLFARWKGSNVDQSSKNRENTMKTKYVSTLADTRMTSSFARCELFSIKEKLQWFKIQSQLKNVHLLLERPSLTRYAKFVKANSTAGLEGKCDKVFGCAGTIWILVASDDPLATRFFLSLDKSFNVIVTLAILKTIYSDLSVLSVCDQSRISSNYLTERADFLCLWNIFLLCSISNLQSLMLSSYSNWF